MNTKEWLILTFAIPMVLVLSLTLFLNRESTPTKTTPTKPTSRSAAVTTTPGLPRQPSLVLKRPVNLRWTRVQGATSYKVYRGTTLIANTTALTFVARIPCNGNIPSTLRVRAVVNGIVSPPSNASSWRC